MKRKNKLLGTLLICGAVFSGCAGCKTLPDAPDVEMCIMFCRDDNASSEKCTRPFAICNEPGDAGQVTKKPSDLDRYTMISPDNTKAIFEYIKRIKKDCAP